MNQETALRIGNGSELPLQASKWLDVYLLVDEVEMKDLLETLGDFKIFRVGALCQEGEGELSKEAFLHSYAQYVECLKRGEVPSQESYRPNFTSVFTVAQDHLFQVPVAGNRRIIRIEKPVLQLQANQLAYSSLDGKFRAMVFGHDNILWGLHFSFPQLYQDGATKEVFTVTDIPQFPNTALFRRLQLWTRHYTVPTPFYVDDKRLNAPYRLGKGCLSWINNHPQLNSQNIRVIV